MLNVLFFFCEETLNCSDLSCIPLVSKNMSNFLQRALFI